LTPIEPNEMGVIVSDHVIKIGVGKDWTLVITKPASGAVVTVNYTRATVKQGVNQGIPNGGSNQASSFQNAHGITNVSQTDDRVKFNYEMFERGDIKFNESTGSLELTVTGKVYDDGTGQGQDFINAVNADWTASTTENGKQMSIRTSLTLTTDKDQASLTLKNCTDCLPELRPDGTLVTNPGSAYRGDKLIFLMPNAGRTTYVHEFGHILGLGHQLDTTNSIMSYSSSAKVLGSDVSRLVSWYYGPYLDAKDKK